MTQVHVARFQDLDATTLYALLRLRVDVFVVEQECAYPELDGRDTEPETLHLWVEDAGSVLGYLRLLADPDGARIGRVCVSLEGRGRGIAEELMHAALARCTGAVVLDAQAHLSGWYERLGFVVAGPRFVEDGIAHVPMHLPTTASPV
jgi:ElaA protein